MKESKQISVKRSELNPKFDGYKYCPTQHSLIAEIGKFALPDDIRATIPHPADPSRPYSLSKWSGLLRANRLSKDLEDPSTYWFVDDARNVVRIQGGITRKVCALQVDTCSVVACEVPVLKCVAPGFLIASDGFGRIHFLRGSSQSNFIAICPPYISSPNYLIDASLGNERDHFVSVFSLLSHTYEIPAPKDSSSLPFELCFVRFDIDTRHHTIDTTVLFQKSVDQLPDWTHLSNQSLTLLTSEASWVPSKLETKKSSVIPYSWVQDDDSVSLDFRTPVGTTKNDVCVTFSSTSVSVKICGNSVVHDAPLYAAVHSTESLWSLSDGTLTIILSKFIGGCRWPHVFDVNDSVAETLPEPELEKIRQTLSKYTVEEGEPSNKSQPSLSGALMENEEECDLTAHRNSTGRTALITLSAEMGTVIDSVYCDTCQYLCSGQDGSKTIIFKRDVDALLYEFNQDSHSADHVTTFHAMAYVQASKRNKRFMSCTVDNSHFVISEGKRLYIYERPKENANTAAHVVIDLAQHFDEVKVGSATDGVNGMLIAGKKIVILSEDAVYVVQIQ